VFRGAPAAILIFYFSRMSVIWFVPRHTAVELYEASGDGLGRSLALHKKANLTTDEHG